MISPLDEIEMEWPPAGVGERRVGDARCGVATRTASRARECKRDAVGEKIGDGGSLAGAIRKAAFQERAGEGGDFR